MLLAFAEQLCREGQTVLYVADRYTTAANNFRRVERSVYGIPGFHAYRSNGNERITHESGGELRFASAGAAKPRGWMPDTLFLDDVSTDWGCDLPPVAHTIAASL